MLSWANPSRKLAPGDGDGVGEGSNSIEQV